ncbi:hypothetical protein [Cyanobium sp. ATX-6F1]|uniref:hypothetical protein n=1 Tax=Cyanobium sp. ATX-6F1 TaxID=3137388 RepID=UPI0039BE7DA9
MLLQQEEWVVQPLGLESPLALEPVLQAQALPLFPGWEPVEWEAQPQALLLRPEREPGVRGWALIALRCRQPSGKTGFKNSPKEMPER